MLYFKKAINPVSKYAARLHCLTSSQIVFGILAGKVAATIPVVDVDQSKPSPLPTADSYSFFTAWREKSNRKNEVTVKS